MKHALKVTLLLITFYVVSQIVGLALLNLDLNVKEVDGVKQLDYSETVLGPRPAVTGLGTFLYLVFGIGIGTALILLIIKYKKFNLWRLWFFLAAFFAMAIALEVVISKTIAFLIGLILAYFKVFKQNLYVHNATEVLVYAGLAVFLVPMLDLKWAIIMMLAFSVYDAYAVWKSKHMVAMAEFQKDSNLFAGLNIPYKVKSKKASPGVKGDELVVEKVKTAVLGGGDIAFPMLFSGAVMQHLVLNGTLQTTALYYSLIITATSALALMGLFYGAQKDKYYPAMPFLTVGCLVGLGLVFLI